MASQMKTKVDTRISHNKVQHIYGAIGGCQNDYVQFPKDAQNASIIPLKILIEDMPMQFQQVS